VESIIEQRRVSTWRYSSQLQCVGLEGTWGETKKPSEGCQVRDPPEALCWKLAPWLTE
jgi:hypothetical protein